MFNNMYADNYIKPRVIPILLIVLLLALGFWATIANRAIFEPRLYGLSFCWFVITLLLFVQDLFNRLWPVRTHRLKDGRKVTIFYLGWWKEVERTEFADGHHSIYVTSDGETYLDPRELIRNPRFKEQLEKLEKSGRGLVDEDAELLD